MKRPHVILADDHSLLLDAFEKLIETEYRVVAKVADGRSLLAAAEKLEPDVIVLDISMPRLNGLDAGQQLRKMLPDTKLIYLTVHEDLDLAEECFRIGASGYLVKSSAASELFEAIRSALDGKTYKSPLPMPRATSSGGQRPPRVAKSKLTPRQREVLQLLAEGYSMKKAADVLNVTPRTIAFHKYRIMENYGLKSTAEIVQFAIKQGLVSL